MIRALRQRHKAMVLAGTLLLPAALALGIAARREIPVRPLAEAVKQGAIDNAIQIWARSDLWTSYSMLTRLLRMGPETAVAVELSSKEAVVHPDVLVYWAPGVETEPGSLPENAYFLGKFEPSNPAPLLLYSLADQELVAVSKSFEAGK